MVKANPQFDHDPSDTVQGHNCQKQLFEMRRTTRVIDPRTKRACQECVMQDQFLNWYLVYSTVMPDGETYDVADWVRDSVLLKYGGFTDECLDAFRQKAFVTFNSTGNEISKLLSIAATSAGKVVEMPFNLGDN